MTAALLFVLQNADPAIGWDPEYINRPLGVFDRVVVLTLFCMACWIVGSSLRTLWSRLRQRRTETERICRRARNLKLIGKTSPMLGLLGTTVRLISDLQAVSYEKSMGLNALPREVADALVMSAIGLTVGIAAHFVAAFVERDAPSLPD